MAFDGTIRHGPLAEGTNQQPCYLDPASPPLRPYSTTIIGDFSTQLTSRLSSFNYQNDSPLSYREDQGFASRLRIAGAMTSPAFGPFWKNGTNPPPDDNHIVSENNALSSAWQDSDHCNSCVDSSGPDFVLEPISGQYKPNISGFMGEFMGQLFFPSITCPDSGQILDYVSLEDLMIDGATPQRFKAKSLNAGDFDISVNTPRHDLFQDTREVTQKPPSELYQSREEVEIDSEAESARFSRRFQRRRSQRPSAIIKEWYRAHSASPYPTSGEIGALVTLSGLTKEQVKQSLSNLRARMKSEIIGKAIVRQAEGSHSTNFTGQYSLSSTTTVQHRPQAQASFASTSASVDNMDDDLTELDQGVRLNQLSHPYSDVLPSPPLQGSVKRKGKRQYPPRYNETVIDSTAILPSRKSRIDLTGARVYECTACCKPFKDSYGWKRHQAGVHGYTDTEWICMLNQPAMLGLKCFFCSDTVTTMAHYDIHDIQACLDKDICERTFARKDLLKQHIQQMHSVSKSFQVPKAWSRKVESSRVSQQGLWCGFCLTMRRSIPERMDHVANHIRDGCRIESWKDPGVFE